jgi:hypothetical protein
MAKAKKRSTTTASASNVVAFPEDIIACVTGIPLADADPLIIARHLRREPWEVRARFFHNAVDDSFTKMMDLIEAEKSEEGRVQAVAPGRRGALSALT